MTVGGKNMFNEYIIKENDTLAKIARENNISLEELATANEWEDLELEVGQKIIIPLASDRPFLYYTIENGDTLYSIADAYGIDATVLAKLNRLDPSQTLFAGGRIIIPKEGYNVYITEENDTIKDILRKTGKSFEELAQFNQTIYLLPEQLLFYKD